MSIYATRITIGTDAPDLDQPGRVRWYRSSHEYGPPEPGPDRTGRPDGIDTAHVPGFCVPGHGDDDEDSNQVGEWLRLAVDDMTVLIDTDAARSLGVDLLAWANLPKVGPV